MDRQVPGDCWRGRKHVDYMVLQRVSELTEFLRLVDKVYGTRVIEFEPDMSTPLDDYARWFSERQWDTVLRDALDDIDSERSFVVGRHLEEVDDLLCDFSDGLCSAVSMLAAMHLYHIGGGQSLDTPRLYARLCRHISLKSKASRVEIVALSAALTMVMPWDTYDLYDPGNTGQCAYDVLVRLLPAGIDLSILRRLYETNKSVTYDKLRVAIDQLNANAGDVVAAVIGCIDNRLCFGRGRCPQVLLLVAAEGSVGHCIGVRPDQDLWRYLQCVFKRDFRGASMVSKGKNQLAVVNPTYLAVTAGPSTDIVHIADIPLDDISVSGSAISQTNDGATSISSTEPLSVGGSVATCILAVPVDAGVDLPGDDVVEVVGEVLVMVDYPFLPSFKPRPGYEPVRHGTTTYLIRNQRIERVWLNRVVAIQPDGWATYDQSPEEYVDNEGVTRSRRGHSWRDWMYSIANIRTAAVPTSIDLFRHSDMQFENWMIVSPEIRSLHLKCYTSLMVAGRPDTFVVLARALSAKQELSHHVSNARLYATSLDDYYHGHFAGRSPLVTGVVSSALARRALDRMAPRMHMLRLFAPWIAGLAIVCLPWLAFKVGVVVTRFRMRHLIVPRTGWEMMRALICQAGRQMAHYLTPAWYQAAPSGWSEWVKWGPSWAIAMWHGGSSIPGHNLLTHRIPNAIADVASGVVGRAMIILGLGGRGPHIGGQRKPQTVKIGDPAVIASLLVDAVPTSHAIVRLSTVRRCTGCGAIAPSKFTWRRGACAECHKLLQRVAGPCDVTQSLIDMGLQPVSTAEGRYRAPIVELPMKEKPKRQGAVCAEPPQAENQIVLLAMHAAGRVRGIRPWLVGIGFTHVIPYVFAKTERNLMVAIRTRLCAAPPQQTDPAIFWDYAECISEAYEILVMASSWD